MNKVGPHYVGLPITIKAIRDFILTHELTEADTVLIHPDNVEALLEEYRTTYRESLSDCYFLLGVLVEEDIDDLVPFNRLVVLRFDKRPHRLDIAQTRTIPEYEDRTICRCGFCGTYTDEAGTPISELEHESISKILKMRGVSANIVPVYGTCCAHEWGGE